MKRLDYIDTAKGILIICMLFGHIFLDGLPHQLIYAFHMPAFFIISGILLARSNSWHNKSMKDIIINKIYSLIIPFCFFECIGVITDIIRFGITLNIKGYLYNTLTMNCNNGPDWFLYCLFVDEVILIIIHKLLKSDTIHCFLIMIISITLIIHNTIIPCAGQIGIGLLFLYFGFLFNQYIIMSNNISVIIAGGLTIIISIINGEVNMAEWFFGHIPLYILGSLIGSYFIINVSKSINLRLLKYIGQNTIIILGTHQAILLPIRHYAKMPVFPIGIGILIFIGIAIIELPIIFLFNKYIPQLCGKKKK